MSDTALRKFDRPHEIVPRDFSGNLEFRRKLYKWCEESRKNRQILIDACARDVLFFTSAMVWTLDNKRHAHTQPVRPFIPYPFQEDLILQIVGALGKHDLVVVKSRDMGGTWCPCIVGTHLLLFKKRQKIVFASRKQAAVDKKNDPDAIFPKIDLILDHLPKFMSDGIEKIELQFFNPMLHTILAGESTTEDINRGGRPTALFCDEFGAFDQAAGFQVLNSTIGGNCRVFVGTPTGQGTAFHVMAKNDDIPRIELKWTMHPGHALGLYKATKERVEFQDVAFWETTRFEWLSETYPLLARKAVNKPKPETLLKDCYPFIDDGMVRSPYFDHEWRRLPFPWQRSQELLCDFVGSGSPFYDNNLLDEYIKNHAQLPVLVGDFAYDRQTFVPSGFTGNKNGSMLLWMNLSHRQGPIRGRVYVIGADVGAGKMVTPSVISVFDTVTMEKVCRYARWDLRPERFAEMAAAVSSWFNDAKIVFEGSGPGEGFGDRLIELAGSGRAWWAKTAKGERAGDPGWFPNGDTKRALLEDYWRALLDGEVVVRDEAALKEAHQYRFGATGLVEHVAASTGEDPASKKKNHSDMWAADAVAWLELKKFAKTTRKIVEEEVQRDYASDELTDGELVETTDWY